MKKIATLTYKIFVALIVLLCCLDYETVRAQEAKKDTLYLNEWVERQYNFTQDRVISDMSFNGFDSNDYSAYHYRRNSELSENLYEVIRRINLRPRDRVKLTDRIYFTINNEYIPGFLQLYQMPIPKPPENPELIRIEDN